MSSREIAELTGKEHFNVMRDIRSMLAELYGEGGVLSFEHTYQNEQNGQWYPCFSLPRCEVVILLTGYSIPLRAKVIDRLHELEQGYEKLFLTAGAAPHMQKVADDEVTKVNRINLGEAPGRQMALVSESGLYKLVMRSDKPQARLFQDWVTRDVLPAIRKDGAYVMGEEKVASGEMRLLSLR